MIAMMYKKREIKIDSCINGERISTKYDEVLDYNDSFLGYAGRIDEDDLLLQGLRRAKKYQLNLKKTVECKINEIVSDMKATITWFNRNRRELSKLLTLESGYPIKHSEELISVTKNYFDEIPHFFSFYQEILDDEKTIDLNYSFMDPYLRHITYKRQPYGVVLCITPSNAPIPLIPIMITSAVLTGNSIIIKPSSKVILSSLKIVEPLLAINPIKDAVNVINTSTRKIMNMGFLNNIFDLVHYTGSSRYVSSLMREAIDHGVELFTEGEGNGIVIVDDNVNVESISDVLVHSIIRCNGELCTSPGGILVHNNVYEPFKKALIEKINELKIGDPLDRNTDIGPLFSVEIAQNLEKQVKTALDQNGKLLVGGKRDNKIFYPTLIEISKSRMNIVKEESFGPLLWIKRYSNCDEILEVFSWNRYGLNLTVFSNKPDEVISFTSKAIVNRVCVNCDPTIQSPFSPWGAMRKTGKSYTDFLPLKYTKKIVFVNEERKRAHTKTDDHFKAIVLNKPKKVELKDVPLLDDKNYIKVKMIWSGICGTDKQAYLGNVEVPYPIVLGHENIGRIASLPSEGLRDLNGNKLRVGDAITWSAIISCGQCHFCRSRLENLCASQKVLGISYPASISPYVFGGWAEYTYLPINTSIVKLNSDVIKQPVIILVEPLATAMILDQYQSEIQNGNIQNLLVLGSGTLGTLFSFYARYIGINEIVMVGSSVRRPIIEKFATHYVPRDKVDNNVELYSLKKDGYDLVINATGSPSTFLKSLDLAKPSGTVLEVGSIGETNISLDMSKIVRNNITVRGHIGYTAKDFVKAIGIVTNNKTNLKHLISGKFPMNKFDEAINRAFSAESFKVVFDLKSS